MRFAVRVSSDSIRNSAADILLLKKRDEEGASRVTSALSINGDKCESVMASMRAPRSEPIRAPSTVSRL